MFGVAFWLLSLWTRPRIPTALSLVIFHKHRLTSVDAKPSDCEKVVGRKHVCLDEVFLSRFLTFKFVSTGLHEACVLRKTCQGSSDR